MRDKKLCRDFAKQLRAARLRAGLTQQRLAELVGADISNVQRWEAGVTKPNANHLILLLSIAGVASALVPDRLAELPQDAASASFESVPTP